MSLTFSYRHLYYFWVVAKEGGMARAAARLDMAVQTVSTQVRELERSLGTALLKPAGRGLVLTEAGVVAMRQADQIFQLGEVLPAAVRDAASSPGVRLAVGISEGLPKLVVRRLLQPVLHEPELRLLCHEDGFDRLLADLALHRLDVVLADRTAPPNPNLKVYSHRLGSSPVAWYAPPGLQAKARRGFPQSLAELPVLLPTAHAAVRSGLDHWFERQGLRPRVVGEFEDSALLVTFGAAGMGVFPAAELIDQKLTSRYEVKRSTSTSSPSEPRRRCCTLSCKGCCQNGADAPTPWPARPARNKVGGPKPQEPPCPRREALPITWTRPPAPNASWRSTAVACAAC